MQSGLISKTSQTSGELHNASSLLSTDSRLAHHRHRILFERLPEAVVITGQDGSILDFNMAALAFFKQSRADFQESNIKDFYANVEEREGLIAQLNQIGQVHDAPTIMVDHHQQVKHCLVTSMRLDTPDGQVYGYQSIIRDVTANRLAEKKLFNQKNYAEQLIDIAPEAIAIINFSDVTIRVNEEFCRLFQYSQEDCIGQRIADLTVPKDRQAESLSLSAQVIGGASVEVETQRIRKDGSLVDVSILAKPIAMENDEPAIYIFYRNITAYKKAQEALRESEERHRTVLEAAPDPVIVKRMDGGIIYLNPAFTRVFGWTIEECQSHAIGGISDDNQQEIDEILDHHQNGQPFSGMETKRYTKDGRAIDVSISGALFFDTKGDPEGYVIALQDITERRKKDEKLLFVAYHDSLTELPNRKSFYKRLDDLLQHSSRRHSDRSWALMFLDLDKFKQINDTLGHDTGDWLLKRVADRLKACLRESDHLFRLGGDEFTIILTNLGRDIDVARVTQKILKTIKRPFIFKGHEIFTSTSIGISVFPNDGWNVERLVKSADMAMYAAKEDGGNSYRFFTEEMNREALHRMQMENSLRKALARDELRLYYQPLVDRSNGIVGMEALLRWNHPELGLVMPADFICICEETGVIVPVGQWVLKTACLQTRQWHKMGFGDLFISVNLTARQLQEPDFEQMVIDILAQSGLPPQCLNLEVTESNMIQDPENSIAKMETLRAKGVTFSIDDFGTGYSSLSYLNRFPIDSIKIDRSFITDAMENKGDQEIVKTIITMAHSLNIDAMAEGVETKEQKDFLIHHGCNNLQGFLFATPLSVDDFMCFLQHHKDTPEKDRLENKKDIVSCKAPC